MSILSLPTQKQVKASVLAAACGGVLAVAIVGGPLLSERSEPSSETAVTPVAAAPAPRTSPAPNELTVFLVPTEADAEALQQFPAGIREVTPVGEVLVVRSAAEEAQIITGIRDSDAIRSTLGLPLTKVVDLRAPAVSVLPLDPAAFSDPEMYQRWRQAQAASVPVSVSHPDWE